MVVRRVLASLGVCMCLFVSVWVAVFVCDFHSGTPVLTTPSWPCPQPTHPSDPGASNPRSKFLACPECPVVSTSFKERRAHEKQHERIRLRAAKRAALKEAQAGGLGGGASAAPPPPGPPPPPKAPKVRRHVAPPAPSVQVGNYEVFEYLTAADACASLALSEDEDGVEHLPPLWGHDALALPVMVDVQPSHPASDAAVSVGNLGWEGVGGSLCMCVCA